MLPVIVIMLFYLIAAVAQRITKSIVHPAFVVAMLWGTLLFAYNILPHGLYPLSGRFYCAVTIWVVSFCFAALLPYKIRIHFPRHIKGAPKTKLVKVLFPVLFWLNIAFTCLVFTTTSGDSLYGFFDSWESRPAIFRWFGPLPYFSIACLLCIFLFDIRIKKYKIALFLLVFIFNQILESNKTMFFIIFCAVFFCLYYKQLLSQKRILQVAIITAALFVAVSEFRPNSSITQNPARFLSIYALSPLPAFDKLLADDNLAQTGVFDYFKKIGAIAGLTAAPKKVNTWVLVPVPTNVYTVMGNYYHNFGHAGLAAFALLLGLFMGIIYKGVMYGIPHFCGAVCHALLCTPHAILCGYSLPVYGDNYKNPAHRVPVFCPLLIQVKTKNMHIDILMATYNGAKHIRTQILSLTGQTCPEWTLFVHDDGSTDNTLGIVKEFAAQDRRIRLVEDGITGLGAGMNFMHLLKHAQAPFVCFCDQDDYWFENKLQTMLDIIKTKDNSRPQVVYTNAYAWYSGRNNHIGEKVTTRCLHKFEQILLGDHGMQGCSAIFNKQMHALLALPYRHVALHDITLLMAGIVAQGITFVDIPLLLYRRHGNNVTQLRSESFAKRMWQAFIRHRAIPLIDRKNYLAVKEFYELMHPEMTPQQQQTIALYLRYPNRSPLRRFLSILRHWEFTCHGSHGLLLLKLLTRKYIN
jgi:rhamnosyltransferase